jgi:hypothetical protein
MSEEIPPQQQAAVPGQPDVAASSQSASVKRFAWLTPLIPSILTGVIGLLAGALGAWTTGHIQLRLEHQRDIEAANNRRRDRAEEIITLVEKTPATYLDAKRAMLSAPTHLSVPTDAERVVALVALYFPDANNEARAYEGACAQHLEELSEIAIAMVKGREWPHDVETFNRMLTTGDDLTAKVLNDIGVTYKARVAVRHGP